MNRCSCADTGESTCGPRGWEGSRVWHQTRNCFPRGSAAHVAGHPCSASHQKRHSLAQAAPRLHDRPQGQPPTHLHDTVRPAVLQPVLPQPGRQHLQADWRAIHLCLHQLRGAAACVPHIHDAVGQLHLQALALPCRCAAHHARVGGAHRQRHLLPLQRQHQLRLALQPGAGGGGVRGGERPTRVQAPAAGAA